MNSTTLIRKSRESNSQKKHNADRPVKVTEVIHCPFCSSNDYEDWAQENGYTAVRCTDCALIYVNPRPSQELISEAVKSGVHSELDSNRTAIARRVGGNVKLYRNVLQKVFADVFESDKPFSWLDVGAGYGEFVEAINSIAPHGSTVTGLEPMTPKVENAQSRGLDVQERYLSEISDTYDIVSLINVFSHIPDFHDFLLQIKSVLNPNGQFFMETGNIADLSSSREAPSELDLPDHLVFAGEKHVRGYLEKAGFSVVSIDCRRIDGFINTAKNIAKKALGRTAPLAIPYTSEYRTMLIRARLP